jgi:hypothetical protein
VLCCGPELYGLGRKMPLMVFMYGPHTRAAFAEDLRPMLVCFPNAGTP